MYPTPRGATICRRRLVIGVAPVAQKISDRVTSKLPAKKAKFTAFEARRRGRRRRVPNG
jgi:hypothetical protein